MIKRDLSWFSDWWSATEPLRSRPAAAVLVTGPAHSGLGEFCLELAAADLCETPLADGSACGGCPSCGWVSQGQHPDLRWVRSDANQEDDQAGSPEGESELAGGAEEAGAAGSTDKKASRDIRIEQIRGLATFAQVSSHRGGRRYVVLGPAADLNFAAANALLKTLEEPADALRFILFADRLEGLPKTILSRCRRQHLHLPSSLVGQQYAKASQVAQWLVPLLAQADRADPMAWAQTAGKADVRQVLEHCQLWLLDLQRVSRGLAPRSFDAQTADLVRQSQLLGRLNTGSLQLNDRLSALQEMTRSADHPLNPRLVFESIFGHLHRVFHA
ncbi:MAG: polymerase delta subunit [Pseudomonadota bacterium]